MFHICAGKAWIRTLSRCTLVLFILSLGVTYSLKFSEPQYDVQLAENTPLGTPIITVNATDPRSRENGTAYSLEPTRDSDSFIIDLYSGEILLVKQLDREVTSTINLTVTATCCDDNTTSSVLARILVLDVDDNGPKFSEEKATVTLTQNFKAGDTVDLPTATDADAPPNDQIKYRGIISSPWNQYFDVTETTGQLRTLKACDQSCSEKFTEGEDYLVDFTVIASPVGSSPPVVLNESTILVTLKLQYNDTNIHSPTFQRDAYVVDVDVSTPADDRVLLTVQAEDPDPGDSGQIEYSFAEDTESRTQSIFGLSRTTGEIRLRYALDGEEALHRFTVVARDKGVLPKSAETEVWVLVTGKAVGAVSGSDIGAIAGSLGGAALILLILLVINCIWLKKLRNQIQEEKHDKENMKRLFQMNQIHFYDSNRPKRRSEKFDQIDESQISNYNEITESAGGYNLPDDYFTPRGIPEGSQDDYIQPFSTLPRSNGRVTSDGYITAVSTSASSDAVL